MASKYSPLFFHRSVKTFYKFKYLITMDKNTSMINNVYEILPTSTPDICFVDAACISFSDINEKPKTFDRDHVNMRGFKFFGTNDNIPIELQLLNIQEDKQSINIMSLIKIMRRERNERNKKIDNHNQTTRHRSGWR